MNFFLDTSILVDILRKNGPAKSFELFEKIKDGKSGYISAITVAELNAGAYLSPRKDAVQKTNELLAHVRIIDTDEKIGRDAGKIYADLKNSGKEVELPDCIIAATARSSGFKVIVTRNIDHFSRLPDFSGITPEEILGKTKE